MGISYKNLKKKTFEILRNEITVSMYLYKNNSLSLLSYIGRADTSSSLDVQNDHGSFV